MKRTWNLISKKTQERRVVAELTYNEEGLLIEFKDTQDLTEGTQFLHHHMPFTEALLAALVERFKVLEAVRYTRIPSFEDFWKKWRKKVKRMRAEKVWERMSDEQKCLAYEKADTPWFNARNNVQYMPHPDKWLAEAGWEDAIIRH